MSARCITKTGRYLRHLYKDNICVRCAVKRDDANKSQPCGHPLSAINQLDENSKFCEMCADDSLRENINKGVEI